MIINRIKNEGNCKKHVYLTFDDGPDERYTPRILDILMDFEAKATFFLVGKNAQKYPHIVKRIKREGHDIGNHTYSHPVSPFFRIKDKNFLKKEIVKTDRIIEGIIGEKPVLFRPSLAFWDTSSKVFMQHIKKFGHFYIGWSLSTADWMGSSFIIRRKYFSKIKKDGDILLLHDGSEKALRKERFATIKTLPDIIRDCLDNSFYPALLTDLL